MTTSTIFLNNRTQAVRLPKAVAFPPNVKRVRVQVVGETRVISPIVTTFAEWAATRRAVPTDFPTDRDQGTFDQRDWGD